MSADLKVVSIQREGWRDAATTLREIADRLESGEIPPCSIGAMVMIHDTSEVGIYGFGPQAEELQTLAAFRLGEQTLIDNILCGD
jgi:hypothetical protein